MSAHDAARLLAGGAGVFAAGVTLIFAIAILDDIVTQVCHGSSTRIACVLHSDTPARAAAAVDD